MRRRSSRPWPRWRASGSWDHRATSTTSTLKRTRPTSNDASALPNFSSTLPAQCGVNCELSIRNEIKVDGRTTTAWDAANVPASTKVKTGLRWCNCGSLPGANMMTPEGRQRCALENTPNACLFNPSNYSTNSTVWKTITTPAYGNSWVFASTTPSSPREWNLAPAADFRIFWDFRTLGSAVATTPFPGTSVTRSQSVTGTWRSFLFPSGEGVGAVLAASYRWQDEAVYFLDESGSTLRLRRWNAQRNTGQYVVQTLATFPVSWNAFAKYDLVATPSWDLLLVARQGTGTDKTWVGQLALSPSNVVSLAALTKSTTPIEAPPAAGHTGYTQIVRSRALEPVATTVTFTSMPTPALADAATLLEH